METLVLEQIVEYARGCLLQGDANAAVSSISTDTRSLGRGELFVALRGENFDGHEHLEAAALAGALGAVVDRRVDSIGLPSDFALIEVDDTLAGYQRIAAAYRRSLSLTVVGITGSNGKTSTKDLTAAVLARRYRVLKTEGNLNNHIGLPRMLLRADRSHEVAVLEMGMNHPGEIAPLASIALPQVAIITNIGRAHLEFMGTREAIAQEKGMLAEAVGTDGTVILNGDDEYTPSISQRTRARVVMVGSDGAALRAESIAQNFAGSTFTLTSGVESVVVRLPVAGRHMITNSLLAVAAGMALGISLKDCATALAEAKLTGGRLERKELHGRFILDDSYNANPDSMVAALDTLAALPTKGRRIAVLGKMGELGTAAAEGYRTVGEYTGSKKIDCLLTVGAEARAIADAAQRDGLTKVVMTENLDEAAARLAVLSRPGDLILVKGSRAAGMERMLTKLSDILADTDTAAIERTSTTANAR